MFRATIVALALGSATAFVARAPSQRVTALRMAEEGASATEEKMDLDLEDMFDLFDEADSEVKAEEGAGFETSAMSQALPWMKRPASLEAAGVKIAGDRGFDPAGFADSKDKLIKFRNAEIKHGRLAMLAAAGWPISERLDGALAKLLGLPSELTENGMAPSVLNGGLGAISPIYWGGVIALAAAVELRGLNLKSDLPGDFGFDPLGLYPKATDPKARAEMQESELRHSRTAMLAITGFAAQEAISKVAVVEETPFFFEPITEFATKNLGLFDLSSGYISY